MTNFIETSLAASRAGTFNRWSLMISPESSSPNARVFSISLICSPHQLKFGGQIYWLHRCSCRLKKILSNILPQTQPQLALKVFLELCFDEIHQHFNIVRILQRSKFFSEFFLKVVNMECRWPIGSFHEPPLMQLEKNFQPQIKKWKFLSILNEQA